MGQVAPNLAMLIGEQVRILLYWLKLLKFVIGWCPVLFLMLVV